LARLRAEPGRKMAIQPLASKSQRNAHNNGPPLSQSTGGPLACLCSFRIAQLFQAH
jgi:hypothetical protein